MTLSEIGALNWALCFGEKGEWASAHNNYWAPWIPGSLSVSFLYQISVASQWFLKNPEEAKMRYAQLEKELYSVNACVSDNLHGVVEQAGVADYPKLGFQLKEKMIGGDSAGSGGESLLTKSALAWHNQKMWFKAIKSGIVKDRIAMEKLKAEKEEEELSVADGAREAGESDYGWSKKQLDEQIWEKYNEDLKEDPNDFTMAEIF